MRKKGYCVLFLIVGIPLILCASGIREKIASANNIYKTGNYNQALSMYEEAEVDNPESPYIYFNKGISYFRLEDYEKAKEAFLSAAAKADDLKLEAKAYYNLGNTLFYEAGRQTETDLKKSIELYQQAITNYQLALERDKNISDAAHNIEVTRLIVKDLLDKLKKQQEQQGEQQEKIKEIAKKIAELIDREQRQIDFTNNLKEEMDSKGTSGNLKKNTRQVKKDQRAIRKETDEVSGKLDELIPQNSQGSQGAQAQGGSPAQAAKEHVDTSSNFQQLTENQLDNTSLAEALESEGNAREELIKALQVLTNPEQQNQDQQKQEDEQQKQQQEEMKQQAEDAEDIIDEEREERRERQIQQSGYREVERDW